VPWVEDPTHCLPEKGVFAQRHESSTLELFFDLFFVANLATFTHHHTILDGNSLAAYAGFFSIIWLTWFQITLHDVRFSQDSVLDRGCKIFQMLCFIGFALAGAHFAPGSKEADNMNFQILSWILFMTRFLLAFQYTGVLVRCIQSGHRDLIVPLSITIGTYVLTGIGYAAMVAAFPINNERVHGVTAVWWIAMAVEVFATIGVSMVWRKLSFKRTHLPERLGLLTLIVVGEGAIGATKTVGRTMGDGLDVESCIMVICITLILVS
jgi:low temperature requirement protein LtrA